MKGRSLTRAEKRAKSLLGTKQNAQLSTAASPVGEKRKGLEKGNCSTNILYKEGFPTLMCCGRPGIIFEEDAPQARLREGERESVEGGSRHYSLGMEGGPRISSQKKKRFKKMADNRIYEADRKEKIGSGVIKKSKEKKKDQLAKPNGKKRKSSRRGSKVRANHPGLKGMNLYRQQEEPGLRGEERIVGREGREFLARRQREGSCTMRE